MKYIYPSTKFMYIQHQYMLHCERQINGVTYIYHSPSTDCWEHITPPPPLHSFSKFPAKSKRTLLRSKVNRKWQITILQQMYFRVNESIRTEKRKIRNKFCQKWPRDTFHFQWCIFLSTLSRLALRFTDKEACFAREVD